LGLAVLEAILFRMMLLSSKSARQGKPGSKMLESLENSSLTDRHDASAMEMG
jgi:hypothetical protein